MKRSTVILIVRMGWMGWMGSTGCATARTDPVETPLSGWVRGWELLWTGERDGSVTALMSAARLLGEQRATPFQGEVSSEPGRPGGGHLTPRIPSLELALTLARALGSNEVLTPTHTKSLVHVEARVIQPEGRDFFTPSPGSLRTGEVIVASEGRTRLDLWVIDSAHRVVCEARDEVRLHCLWPFDPQATYDFVVRNSGLAAERYLLVLDQATP